MKATARFCKKKTDLKFKYRVKTKTWFVFIIAIRKYNSILKKVLPHSFPSVRPGADPSVQAVSPQVTF